MKTTKGKKVSTKIKAEAVTGESSQNSSNSKSSNPASDQATNTQSTRILNKTLYRLEDDKMIAGVCSGLALYFDNFDPTIVRVIFAVLTLFGAGWTIPLYIALWVIMPSGSKNENNIEVVK